MGYYFFPHQIAEMAMDVEQAGAGFYRHLADKTQDEPTRKVFRFLSGEELNHYEKFSKIASQIRQNDPGHEYSVDVAQLLRQSVEDLKTSVFSFGPLGPGSIPLGKCFEIAIRAEQESVHIYKEIYGSFAEKFHPVVLKIIQEEEQHLETLANVQKKLNL